MELHLGCEASSSGGDFVLWDDIAPDAVPLVGDDKASSAAATGAALVCTDPERALRAGVRADGIIIDAGTSPTAAEVEACLASGYAVLVTLEGDSGAGLLAAASVYAWLGVRVFRTDSADAEDVRQVLDMVASIKGTRPPKVSRRGLA
jgi:hypothetical protein